TGSRTSSAKSAGSRNSFFFTIFTNLLACVYKTNERDAFILCFPAFAFFSDAGNSHRVQYITSPGIAPVDAHFLGKPSRAASGGAQPAQNTAKPCVRERAARLPKDGMKKRDGCQAVIPLEIR